MGQLIDTGVNASFSQTVFLGLVKDNKDPKKRGRVQVFVPQLHKSPDEVELPWAIPISPLFGGGAGSEQNVSSNNWGFFMVPQINEWVVLTPLLGDVNTLLYFGSIRSIHQPLPNTPNDAGTDDPSTYELRFPNGHRFVVRTDPTKDRTTIETNKGYIVDLDDVQDVVTVKCSNSTITMTAAGDITITGQTSITVASTGPVVVQGSTINMN